VKYNICTASSDDIVAAKEPVWALYLHSLILLMS